jgi:hypothetical protein
MPSRQQPEVTPVVPFKIKFSITNDNEPGGIENGTHNTFPKLTWLF